MRGCWALGVAVLVVGAASCADEVECPEGRDRVGNRCELEQEGSSSMTGDDAGDGQPGPGHVVPDANITADSGLDAPGKEDAAADAAPELACLADFDGDGYGAPSDAGCEEGIMSGDCADDDDTVHPSAIDTCADGADRDCDGNPGISEVCNGVDDDCDSIADNGYACAVGASNVACTTTCGSTGKGSCTSECAVPTGAACTPPAETCNWKDDNCDGVADEGLLSRLTTDGYALHGTVASADGGVQTALAKRSGGGAWLITGTSTTLPTSAPLAAQELDGRGKPVGAPRSLLGSDRMQMFVADSDGTSLAILGTVGSSQSGNLSNTLLLVVYDAATLSLKAQQELAKFTDDPGTSDDCDRLYPLAASVSTESNGQALVAIGFASRRGGTELVNGCASANGRQGGIKVVRVGAQVLYESSIDFGFDASTNLASKIEVVKFPCREEWLASIADYDSGQRTMRFSANMTEDVRPSLGFPLRASACEGDKSWVSGGYDLYRPDAATGALTKIAERAPMFALGDLLPVSGRWFAFGFDNLYAPRILEFSWDKSFADRTLALGDSGPSFGSYPRSTPLKGAALPRGLLAALALDDVVVAAFARGNGATLSVAGKPAAAISYRFGCN